MGIVWVDQRESFACSLDECTFELGIFSWICGANEDATHDANRTSYECKKVKCQCIPGRMLCGEDGSLGSCSQARGLR